MRLIDNEGKQVGILPVKEALWRARNVGLDLVEISPNTTPPVAKIVNYGKFKYQQQQKEKETRKHQPKHETKELRFRVNIETHDFQTKAKQAVKFLSQGHKVKATVMFKGREQSHPDHGKEILENLVAATALVGSPENGIKREGRGFSVLLQPSTTKQHSVPVTQDTV